MTFIARMWGSLVRVGEKYTQTDIRYAVKGNFWLGMGQIAASLSSLCVAVVFAHYLSKDVYGVYKYVLSIGTIIASFSLSGLSTSIIRSVAQGDEYSLVRGFNSFLKSGLGMVLLGTSIGAYYLFQGNTTLGAGLVVAGIFLPLIGASSLYDSYLQGKKLFPESAFFSLFNTLIPVLVLILSIFFFRTPLPLIIIYFASNAAVDYISYRMVLRRHERARLATPASETKAYGVHLSAMNVFTTLSTQIDQVLVFHLLGAGSLAVYAFAIAIPEQMKGFLKNIGSLALPKFSTQDSSEGSKGLLKRTALVSLVICVPVLIYIFAAPAIFSILFPAYESSAFYSQIFAASLITGSNALPLAYLQAQKRIRSLYQVNVTNGVVQIALIVLLGVPYGILGVVCARIISRVFAAIFTLYIATR